MPKRKPKEKLESARQVIRLYDFFSPNEAINGGNSRLFVGRELLVANAIDAVEVPSSTVIVYGERGAGKTSFARLVMHLASQLQKPAKRAETDGAIGKEEVRNRFVWQKVSPGVETIEDVLYRILDPRALGPESLVSQFPGIADLIKDDYLKLDPIKVMESTLDSAKGRVLNAHQKLVYALFERVEQFILGEFPKVKAIVVIDELDQLKDLKGLGRLIKNSGLNFLLVGIANNVQEIVADHESAKRKIAKEYRIPRFDLNEVSSLFGIAEKIASEKDLKLKFTDGFIAEVFSDSAGIPGRCQKIGAAVLERYGADLAKGERISVSKEDYVNILTRKDNPYIHDSMSSDLINNCLVRGNARWQILKALGEKDPDGCEVGSLNNFPPSVQNNLDKWLAELVSDKVVVFDKWKKRVTFADSDLWGEVRRRIRVGWEPKR